MCNSYHHCLTLLVSLLPIVLLCLRFWLLQQHGYFLWSAAAAVVVFRSEVAILLGLVLLGELWSGRVSLGKVLGHGLPAGLLCLGT